MAPVRWRRPTTGTVLRYLLVVVLLAATTYTGTRAAAVVAGHAHDWPADVGEGTAEDTAQADEGEPWMSPLAPPRRAALACKVTAVAEGYRLSARYRLTLDAHDPLLDALRTGRKSIWYVSDLSGAVFETPPEDTGLFTPSLTYTEGERSAVAELEINWLVPDLTDEVTLALEPSETHRYVDAAELRVDLTTDGYTVRGVPDVAARTQQRQAVTVVGSPAAMRFRLSRETPGQPADFASGSYLEDLRNEWPPWPAITLIPLVFLLAGLRHAKGALQSVTRAAAAGTALVAVVLLTAALEALDVLDTSWWNTEWATMNLFLLGSLPVALVAAPAGIERRSLAHGAIGIATLAGTSAAIVAGLVAAELRTSLPYFIAAAALVVATAALGRATAAVALRTDSATVTGMAGLVAAAVAVAPIAIATFDFDYWVLAGQLARAAAWSLVLVVMGLVLRLSWRPTVLLGAFGLVGAFIPAEVGDAALQLDVAPDWFVGLAHGLSFTVVQAGLATLGLAVAALYARRHQARPGRAEWAATLTLVVAILALPVQSLSLLGFLATVAVLLILRTVVPLRQVHARAALFATTRGQHNSAMQAQLDHHTAVAGSVALRRAIPGRITGGEAAGELIQQANATRRNAELDADVGRARDRALASGAGVLPYANGLAAVRIGGLLALPVIVFELVIGARAVDSEPFFVMAAFFCYTLRWLAYAFAFGYLYPALRGRTPLTKAIGLATAILAIEICRLAAESGANPDWRLAAGIRTGQILVFALGLGLLWERRLSMRAGVAWGVVRDFRTLRALAVPVTTVLVAVGTTAATILAGAAMNAVVGPTPAGPSGSTLPTADYKPPNVTSPAGPRPAAS